MAFEEAFPNVFVVKGTSKLAPGLTISKTMTVIRQGTELTVINSAVVDEDELKKLGTVKHLVRIGGSHGLDDPWYVQRFKPTTWQLPRMKHRAHGKSDKDLVEGGGLPIDAKLYVFNEGKQDEAVLLFGQVLITCDSLQAWRSTEGSSLVGGFMTKRMGFLDYPVIIGPIWLKKQHKDVHALEPDFERIKQLDFMHLIAGHGDVLRDGAREEVGAALTRTFG